MGDRGRDALHQSQDSDEVTIFAYSVRSDWLRKLQSDCSRIQEEDHKIDKLIFVCTSTLSGNDRDKAKSTVLNKFGWLLEVYDLERIRVLLTGEFRYLVAQHPSIFCPPWFITKGGLSIVKSADTLIIDHIASDHALAVWLARRLSLAGYKTWCLGTAPLTGEDIDASIKLLIQNRAIQYIPLLSLESFNDNDFIARCGIASMEGGLTLPCWTNDLGSRSTIL